MNQSSGTKKKKVSAVKASGKSDKKTTKLPVSKVKDSIVGALSHSEAEDGLYFRNFFLLHEEDQRPGVKASKKDLLNALNELLEEGIVKVDFDELEVTFRLASNK